MIGRWVLTGLVAGGLASLVAFAPASWLAYGVAQGSAQRFLLAQAQGSIWRGDATVVLTGGPQSQDARSLPGRLHWGLGFEGLRPALWLEQACCIDGRVKLLLQPGWNRFSLDVVPLGPPLAPEAGASPVAPSLRSLGHWPVAWLEGLGAPWNTLRPSGTMQLSGRDLRFEIIEGRMLFSGQAEMVLSNIASRVSTLDALGDYVISVQGGRQGQGATVNLRTLRGALQLGGEGQWVASKLRFRGQASAAPGQESALNNLLNIIGRRQGAQSILSIG